MSARFPLVRSYAARQEALRPLRDEVRRDMAVAAHNKMMNAAVLAQDPVELWGRKDCELCGERFTRIKLPNGRLEWQEVGEFWKPDSQDSVIAHAQCGLDAGLELA